MVVINLRLGLQAHKAWGDHAFPSLAGKGKGPPAARAAVDLPSGEPDREVEEAAALILERAFAAVDPTVADPETSLKKTASGGPHFGQFSGRVSSRKARRIYLGKAALDFVESS